MSIEPYIQDEKQSDLQGMLTDENLQLNRDFQMNDLVNLFFKPSKFATTGLNFVKSNYIYILALIVGLAKATDRIDKQGMKYSLTMKESDLINSIMNNWAVFWIYAVLIGIFGVFLIYWIWGSWYSVRIKWSGCKDIDFKEGRALYMWTAAMGNAPFLISMIVSTFMYKNFVEYFATESMLSYIFIVIPFWKCICDYKILRARYNLRRWPARMWFIILPYLLMLSGFALMIMGYLMMEM